MTGLAVPRRCLDCSDGDAEVTTRADVCFVCGGSRFEQAAAQPPADTDSPVRTPPAVHLWGGPTTHAQLRTEAGT